jgi:hypothetical protein
MQTQAINARIDPAYQRLLQLLASTVAGRTSGDIELKVIVRDGVIKASFVKSDEHVALKQ